jgi:hypothetical protein
VVATAIAMMLLLGTHIYGDRIEGGGNRLVRDLDQCMDEPPMSASERSRRKNR